VLGIFTALVLVSGGSIGTAHYLGVIDARDWYQRSITWLTNTTTAATAAADTYFNHQQPPSAPIVTVDIQRPDLSFDQYLSENEKETSTATPSAAPQKKPLSESAQKSLRNGIAMMTKDLKEVEREIAQRREQLIIHSPNWRPPTAAEREVLGLDYLRTHGKLSNDMYTRVTDVIRNARADLTNHRTRITELSGVRDSLIHRTKQAQEKLGEPITP
jgi:hypothetical protein